MARVQNVQSKIRSRWLGQITTSRACRFHQPPLELSFRSRAIKVDQTLLKKTITPKRKATRKQKIRRSNLERQISLRSSISISIAIPALSSCCAPSCRGSGRGLCPEGMEHGSSPGRSADWNLFSPGKLRFQPNMV